jgi:hypothetical protein
MAYTYADPTNGVFDTPVSNVRYLVEDTTPAAPFSLSDGEITVEVTAASGNITLAAANVAYKMARRYAKEATTSKSVGNLSLSRNYDGVASSYLALASDLRSGLNKGSGAIAPIFTGADIPQQFAVGQYDYPALTPDDC